ncbi:tyrosinase family protein [Bradyrhizobium sp. BWA-3-5]|uniref:tyrosinase family protein n=1 Tax=Bradyrhizobium sp. BWA-3-5 TaxID=3080013 RepID=UPI00293E3F53|nr:tyrosinase family protein [Bradyrhizobium sp. BWA-3-5]WOH63671.1 tyrosinase family protein [Bradyrhizobium sp. BWA-3-5]
MAPKSSSIDRRTFLISALAAGSSGVIFPALGQSVQVEPRKSIGLVESNPAELQLLRDAVQILQSKDGATPAADGWEAIANPHVNNCFTGDSREIHFSWWFWPWHRAYLVAMERRLQFVVNEPKLRLPYWDWFSTRDIPAAIKSATYQTSAGLTKPNPLFDATRAMSAAQRPPPLNTETITDAVLAGYANEEELLRSANFSTVGGRTSGSAGSTGIVELGPHNNLHVWIGGRAGNMAQAWSPRDPAFIFHHCNIDRLWQAWTELNTGGAHTNPTDLAWLDKTFPMPHPSGVGVEIYKIGDLLNTNALGYKYEQGRMQIAQQGVPDGPGAGIKLNEQPLDLSSGRARTSLRQLSDQDGARIRSLAPTRPGSLQLNGVSLPSSTSSFSVHLLSESDRNNSDSNRIGIYTLLNPSGKPMNTNLSIPLPTRIAERVASQQNVEISVVVDSPERERLAGFTINEIKLVFE